MAEILKTWLKKQIDALATVKRCTFGQDPAVTDPPRKAELVVHLWVGIHVHIHIIDTALNTRIVRRIVENTTNNGIGVLFLLAARLLPKPGEKVDTNHWFMAIHALTEPRLYAYTVNNGEPTLRQIHFEKVGITPIYETRYGPEIPIAMLRCYRHTVRAKNIKGFWMVADFGPDINKKPPKTSEYRAEFAGTPPGYNGSSHHRAGPLPVKKTGLELAYALLGIEREATRDEARAAFRKLAFALHPDVSALPKNEAEARFKALSEAYEIIKRAKGWS